MEATIDFSKVTKLERGGAPDFSEVSWYDASDPEKWLPFVWSVECDEDNEWRNTELAWLKTLPPHISIVDKESEFEGTITDYLAWITSL